MYSFPFVVPFSIELLAHLIRSNRNIIGANIKGKAHVIILFADDITLFLYKPSAAISVLNGILYTYQIFTGLKINNAKSKLLCLNTYTDT